MQEYGSPVAEGQEGPQYSDINQLLDRILLTDVSIDNSRKVTVEELRMKPALFSVFCWFSYQSLLQLTPRLSPICECVFWNVVT